jgi:hypothetical protein
MAPMSRDDRPVGQSEAVCVSVSALVHRDHGPFAQYARTPGEAKLADYMNIPLRPQYENTVDSVGRPVYRCYTDPTADRSGRPYFRQYHKLLSGSSVIPAARLSSGSQTHSKASSRAGLKAGYFFSSLTANMGAHLSKSLPSSVRESLGPGSTASGASTRSDFIPTDATDGKMLPVINNRRLIDHLQINHLSTALLIRLTLLPADAEHRPPVAPHGTPLSL